MPRNLDGASLLGLVAGASDRGERADWRAYIDLEHDRCYARENQWNALTDGRGKYIYHSVAGREQLFGLEDDPGETLDLSSDPRHREALEMWRGRLVEHLSERGKPFVSGGKLLRRPERTLYSPLFPEET